MVNAVLKIALVIFFSEILTMTGLSFASPAISGLMADLVDVVALILMSSLMILLWVIRPYVREQNIAKEEKAKSRESLENTVEARTEKLRHEIAERRQAEQRLQESDATLRTLLNSIEGDYMALWDQDGELKFANFKPAEIAT